MHAHTRPCTLVGELGWVPAALPSIQRGIYRGRSRESIDYLHTPASGAGKVGYGWEMGIPVWPHHGVVPRMQNPNAGHPRIYWMERSLHHQASLDQHWDAGTVFESCTYWHVGARAVPASQQGWSCCPLAAWGFAAFWDHPYSLWQCGEGEKGLRGSWRKSHGPADRLGHQVGPTRVRAKRLTKGISE